MKYLGNETKVEVKTKSVRKVEYIRCDGCGKKIMPYDYRTRKDASYVHIHTWHNDWGNDSVDSHEYGDYCKECAKSFVSAYVDKMNGSEELELKHEVVHSNETYEGYERYDDGYALAEDDEK